MYKAFMCALMVILSLIFTCILAMSGVNYVVDGYGMHPLACAIGITITVFAGWHGMGGLEEACEG